MQIHFSCHIGVTTVNVISWSCSCFFFIIIKRTLTQVSSKLGKPNFTEYNQQWMHQASSVKATHQTLPWPLVPRKSIDPLTQILPTYKMLRPTITPLPIHARYRPQSKPIIPRNYSQIITFNPTDIKALSGIFFCANTAASESPAAHQSQIYADPLFTWWSKFFKTTASKYFATFFTPVESFFSPLLLALSNVDPKKKSKNLNVIILGRSKTRLLGSHRSSSSFLNHDQRFDLGVLGHFKTGGKREGRMG